jgi:ribonuclease R
MADKVGDEFDGYITGVTAFGLFIELIEHFVEGLVHVSTMADDYYRFVERAHTLHGENTGRVYRLGDRVTVQVLKVDMERRQIDLGLSEILDRVRESEKNRGPRRSRIDLGPKPHGARTALPRRSDSVAKGGTTAKKAVVKTKRRAQRPGRKERSAKRGKQR